MNVINTAQWLSEADIQNDLAQLDILLAFRFDNDVTENYER